MHPRAVPSPEGSSPTAPRPAVVLLIVLAVITGLGLTYAALAVTGHTPGFLGSSSVEVPDEDDGGWAGVRLPRTRAGHSYSFGGPVACIRGAATEATIESVELVDPRGGMTIRHFAVHIIDDDFEPGSLGAEARSLKALGWPVDGPQVLRTKCDGSRATGAEERTTGIPVEVSKPTDATAGASAILLHWRIGHHRGKTLFPLAIGLCEADEEHCPDFIPDDI
jgi:hypothetical protein